MYFGNIKSFSIENGSGIRVSLFVSGCRNHCEQCFSKQTWDFNYGRRFDEDTADRIIAQLQQDYCAGLTVLGGEPMEAENQQELLPFLKRVRAEVPDKTIWVYTGFYLGDDFKLYDLLQTGDMAIRAQTPFFEELLAQIDILVDGRYDYRKRNIALNFRGSENQRIIDVRRSLSEKKIVLAEL